MMVHRTLTCESLRGMELSGPQASGTSPRPGVEESCAPTECFEIILAVLVAVFFVSYGVERLAEDRQKVISVRLR